MINDFTGDDRWIVIDAHINMGGFDRNFILDFGIEPISDEMAMELFNLTQIEVETLPADLGHFKKVIAGFLSH